MAETATPTRAPALTTPGLRVATAAGVCLVAYSYLAGLWPSRHGSTPEFVAVVRAWLNKPTGLGEDFGYLGTALLVLIAGYAITGALCTGRRALLVRAAVPLVAAAALGGVLFLVGAQPLVDVAVAAPVGAVLLFTALTAAVLPLLRVHPVLAVFVLLEVACVIALVGGWLGGDGGSAAARAAGAAAALVPLLAFGQLSWLFRANRLPAAHGVALGVLCLALTVPSDLLFPEYTGFWRPLGGVVAALLFLIALPRGEAFAATRPVRWVADRAWPLALAVPVVGYPVLGLLAALPFALALPVAVAATGAAAEALHRRVGWSA
ncbi:hypothetical protein [Saccharothrix sp.]|uniref:hypothetical protein n=1 Tax=Saccharothrix sp. TaxID=1873460 RepID=UPI002810DA1B|nr:hypothetical protein [Saccharothrix sp.]